MTTAARSEPGLVRALGLLDATMLVAGIVIGTGIFLTPGVVAAEVRSTPLLFLVWVLGALYALLGALLFAELGAAMPGAGGQYAFLCKTLHPLFGFLYGWAAFWMIRSASIAAVAVGFAEFFAHFAPGLGSERALLSVGGISTVSAAQAVALALIALLTLVNVLGVRAGGRVQTVFGLSKIAASAGLALAGFLFGRMVGAAGEVVVSPDPPSPGVLAGIGAALVAVSWTYDGWNDVTFAGAEVKNPTRNIPRSLVLGVGLIAVFYLGMNLFYVRALGLEGMVGPDGRGVVRVAEAAAERSLGPGAASWVCAAVAISAFGCVNGMVLAGGRLYYAMARDGVFFRRLGSVHPRFRTPHVSLLAQGVVSGVLALSGRYDQLFTFAMFAALLSYAVLGAGLFRFRARAPTQPRPFSMPGYPWTLAIFVAASTALVLNSLLVRPVESLAGTAFLAAGVPLYFFWSRRTVVPPQVPPVP